MENMIDLITDPFTQYAFMRRALAACVVLAVGGTPLGVFMMLRRMTLIGDAMSHAILPGVALAFVFCGASLWPMTLGGLVAGVIVAVLAMALTRFTSMQEDASFTLFYLLSLSLGVVLVSMRGSAADLMHLLFGNILAIDEEALYLVLGVAVLTLVTLAVFYRGLVVSCFDPSFAQGAGGGRNFAPFVFFFLLVLNLIAAFQALGTLMALGVMILPALAARFWSHSLDVILPLSVGVAVLCAPIGLLVSYYAGLPSGPCVVLIIGVWGVFSAVVGRYGSVRAYFKG